MTKKQRTIRIIVNSGLLVAVLALGITVYQAGTKDEAVPQEITENEERETSFFSEEEDNNSVNMEDSQTTEETTDREETESQTKEQETEADETTSTSVDNVAAEESANTEIDTSSQQAELNFTEDSLMEWPVNGSILMDYSPDKTTYFQTLDQYRINPALILQADPGTQVSAAADGSVYSVYDDPVIGTTVIMELGNGYQAVYGQLQDVTVAEGETVIAGSPVGCVAEPTKYYEKEGSNLYFALKKDGEPVDPIVYLP